jgi:hypothetical protein
MQVVCVRKEYTYILSVYLGKNRKYVTGTMTATYKNCGRTYYEEVCWKGRKGGKLCLLFPSFCGLHAGLSHQGQQLEMVKASIPS